MNDSATELFTKGVQFANEGDTKKAFKAFKSASKKAPDSARYHFAAAQTAKDQNTAFLYTKKAWERGLKNKTVFLSLLQRSFHTDKKQKLAYALALFEELPDSDATPAFKGTLFFQFGNVDSALALWRSEYDKSRKTSLIPQIANALARKGELDTAIDFLYQAKNEKNLDLDGYTILMSLLALRYQFDAIDRIHKDLSESNLYNDKFRLDYSTILAFNNRCDEAGSLLEKPLGPASPPIKALLNLRFNTVKILCAINRADSEIVDLQLSNPPSDSVLNKKVQLLFTAIKAYVDNDTNAYALLFKARKQLPPDPVTVMINARAALKSSQYKEAVSLYNQLPKTVLWSPQVVAERAQATALSGNDDEALKIISFMHNKHIFTRRSLELFRDLTARKDLFTKSQAAQKLLESKYSDDVNLKWKGLLLAIKGKKLDTALTIAQELSEKYPDESRFFSTYLSLLLLNKEYKTVLEVVKTGILPEKQKVAFEASALKGLGDTTRAIKAYEQAVKEDKKNFPLTMQLAELYYHKKSYKKASDLFARLTKEKKSASTSQDSTTLAVLLNNNAWTLMSAGNENLSAALGMVKKAHEILPDNVHIIDTYCSILMKSGKYKECISLLDNPVASKEKRLVCHMAEAWGKMRNRNKARRFYEDALALKNEHMKLSCHLTNSQIRERINRLATAK